MKNQVSEAMEECETCLKNQMRRWRHQYFHSALSKRPTREFTHQEKRLPLYMADEVKTGKKPTRKGAE